MSKLAVFLLGLILIFGCQKQEELGSRNNPIKLYFTPSVDAQIIASNSQEFLKYIEKETGMFFETGIPTNYIAVVEAFGSQRADIAVMNSFGYLMANEKYGAHAKLTVLRYGENFYRGQIIASTKSNIKEVKDLQGKKFAFTDPSSTSGYMFPLKILKENQVTPESTVFAQKHDNVVTMVYQGQVDAGATFYSPPGEDGTIRDARARVKTQFPDVEDKVKIVALTEKIPNDPFVFRKDLPDLIVEKFITALKKFLSTESGQKVFKNIYSVDSIVDSTDADYDGLRTMVKAINLNKEELVK